MVDTTRSFDVFGERAAHYEPAFPESDLAGSFWMVRVGEQRLGHVLADDWTLGSETEQPTLPADAVTLFRSSQRRGEDERVFELHGTTCYLLRRRSRSVHAVVAARSHDEAVRVMAQLHDAYPADEADDARVEVTFWSWEDMAAEATSRRETLEFSGWQAIAQNYAARTRAQLEPLMKGIAGATSGQLMLWLGPPGTGKTFALRALAWELRERVEVHCVLDPEVFLGRARYMTELFLDESSDDDDDDFEERRRPERRERDRLIVLEDAGELIGADARAQVGQGISRLLNMADGLAGQATRTRLLITTNEDVGRLHPAITRPGRCSALVRFAPLDENESAAWLRSRSREDLVGGRSSSSTLAELFALIRGDPSSVADALAVGFRHRP